MEQKAREGVMAMLGRELFWASVGDLAGALEAEAKAWRESVEADRVGDAEAMQEASAVLVCLQAQRLRAHDAVRGTLAMIGADVLARRVAGEQEGLALARAAEPPF